jgi:hypothetical protein
VSWKDIKVDVLLGDFDRGFDPEIYKTSQYPIEIIHAGSKQNRRKGFDYLIERKIPAVNVVWATGRRAIIRLPILPTSTIQKSIENCSFGRSL